MKRKIIVSDSSILISFAKIKKLNFLKELAGKVIIPQAVYNEVIIKGKPGTNEILSCDWIETKVISNEGKTKELPKYLGKGEKEAIILAKELDGLLLIDDPAGIKEAIKQSIQITGTLGVLQEIQAKGVIDKIKPILDSLIASGFRIDSNLYIKFLEEIGE